MTDGSTAPGGLTSERLGQVYSTLLADTVTARTVTELRAAGIPVLLLKGPSLARWLYGDGAFRPYADTDLLVPASREAQAMEVLGSLGFVDLKAGVPLADLPLDHARTLVHRLPSGVQEVVDLHTTLPQALTARARAFDVLQPGAEVLEVAGASVPVLGPAGRALTVVLHAAHDAQVKPLEDLRRAVAQVPLPVWRVAGELAEQLGVVPVLAHGLRLTPDGAALAEQLFGPQHDLPQLHLPGPGESPLSDGVRRLLMLPTVRERLGLVAREVVPSPTFVRWWWAQRSDVRPPLPVLYVRRWVYLAVEGRHYVAAMAAARRTR